MEFMKDAILLLIGFGVGYLLAKKKFAVKEWVDEKQEEVLGLNGSTT